MCIYIARQRATGLEQSGAELAVRFRLVDVAKIHRGKVIYYSEFGNQSDPWLKGARRAKHVRRNGVPGRVAALRLGAEI